MFDPQVRAGRRQRRQIEGLLFSDVAGRQRKTEPVRTSEPTVDATAAAQSA